jgi:hypothetical protein
MSKQFLYLTGNENLFQQTAQRLYANTRAISGKKRPA